MTLRILPSLRHTGFAMVVVALVNLGLFQSQLMAALSLVDFESSEWVAVRSVDEMPGWHVMSGLGLVDTLVNGGVTGTHSLRLPASPENEARVTRDISWVPDQTVAFIDFRYRPAANPEGSTASIYCNGSQLAFQVPSNTQTGQIWAYHGNDDREGTQEQWLQSPASYHVAPGHAEADAFVRVTLRHDYEHRVWDLFVDGKLAAANLGFDGRDDILKSIEFYGGQNGDCHIDDLQADPSNMLFPDSDKDGLPDAWELANGSNPSQYDRDAINPITGKTWLDQYMSSLWTATSPNGGNGSSVSGAPIPPLTLLSFHRPVGALKGSLSVAGDGSSSYAIPLDLPKGTAGMEPKLSLNYSSNTGNGLLGLGWSLGGLQKITRGPSSYAKDGEFHAVSFTSADRYYLDGERLVCVSGSYGAAGSTYRTEMDSFARITAIGQAGSGPASWLLQTKAGLRVELGATADAREDAAGSPVSPGALSWSVNKVSDTLGNYYSVEYARGTASGYSLCDQRVSAIRYTGNGTSLAPYCSVEFQYETRPDQGRAFASYAGYLVTQRLSSILVKTGTYLNHSYVLTYENSWQTGRSLLASVRKLANGNPALAVPATTFRYSGLTQGQPLWVQQGGASFPVYGSGWDATGNVNSMVGIEEGGTAIRLTGDVFRSYANNVTLYPDSRLQLQFRASALDSGALIGFETDLTYNPFEARLFRVGGSGTPGIALCNSYAYSGSDWVTLDIPVGTYLTGPQAWLVLGCVDDNATNGTAEAVMRNLRLYRSGTQQPADVQPLTFGSTWEMPHFKNSANQDQGIRFIDLNSDGLPDLVDWRSTQWNLNGTTLTPATTGNVYRNTGSGFVADPGLTPPSSLPLGSRANDIQAYQYGEAHHLNATPVDINGDGVMDLFGSADIIQSSTLANSHVFFTRAANGTWQELTAYRLPFRSRNLPSAAPYGGVARHHHFEWVDLDQDGAPDLAVHTTAYGELIDTAGNRILGPDSGTVYLNRVRQGGGWVRRDDLALPKPLRVVWPQPTEQGRSLLDLDGDGKPEFIESQSLGYSEKRETYFLPSVQIPSSPPTPPASRWTPLPGTTPIPASPWDLPATAGGWDNNAPLINSSGKSMATAMIDLNGDGLPDVVRSLLSGTSHLGATWLNHGNSLGRWTAEPVPADATAQIQSYRMPRPLYFAWYGDSIPFGYEIADINGDGLKDVLYSNFEQTPLASPNNLVMVNTGNGWAERADWGIPGTERIYTNYTQAIGGQRRAMLQDVNGDGFPDLITGLMNEVPKIWINQCQPEVLREVTDGFGSTLAVEYKRLNDPSPVVGSSRAVYEPSSSPLPAGHIQIRDSRLVVSRLLQPDGNGGQRVTRRHYGDLRADRDHDASLGFGWTEAWDELTGSYTRTETSRSWPFAGSPVKSETYVNIPSPVPPQSPGVTPGLKLAARETSAYGLLPAEPGISATGIQRPVQTYNLSEHFDPAGVLVSSVATTQNPSDFDPYGFLLNSTSTALDGSSTSTSNTYNNLIDSDRWLLGRLATSSVTRSAPGTASRTKSSSFTYNPISGLIASETVEPGNQNSRTTSYTRDGFGNVIGTSLSSPSAAGTRNSTVSYDPKGRFPLAESNSLGHTASHNYDWDRALLLSSTDANGLVSSFEYDAFGTRLVTNHPDGTRTGEITRIVDNSDLPAPVASQLTTTVKWARVSQSSGTPWTTVYFDALGREVATESTTLHDFDGISSTWRDVYTVTRYDIRGRKTATSLPFHSGEAPLWTTITYDALDRILATAYPDGTSDAVISFQTATLGGQPAPYAKVRNKNNQTLERWEDQHGRLAQSRDPSGQTTTFGHDADGNLTTVKIDGTQLLSNTWDIFGNKTSVWDADAGSSSSTYDGFGQTLTTTNALGQTSSTSYDSLGRPVTVARPEGTWTYSYDSAPGAGKGKPSYVSGPSGYAESYTYDSLGRSVATSTTRFGETFSTSTTYDPLGRVLTETDAGGLAVVHDYDSQFSAPVRLREFATNTTLWEARSYDSTGHATSQILAHGVRTDRPVDPANGHLLSATATRATTILQNLAYSWDPNGNLLTRADSVAGTSESFGYDNLNRLVSSAIAGQTARTYSYAANGNLLSNGADTLQYANSRPHAVSSATIKGESRTYQYDAAGHVLSDTRRSYQWTSFGQVSQIYQANTPPLSSLAETQRYQPTYSGYAPSWIYQSGQSVATFDFDASGSRARQFLVRTFADSSSADVTTLYLGSYEREIHRITPAGSSAVVTRTVHRHSLGGVAVWTREESAGQSAVTKLAALIPDHLGSTDVLLVATRSGNTWGDMRAERQSYTPWGERRNADNWSNWRSASTDPQRASSTDWLRGFTGHEQLDTFGLIHMNGRIYDPELARFLSPDPVVQIPEFSQNFNRYSYVLNNPMTYSDPTGHRLSGIVAVVACIVIAVVSSYTCGAGASALGGVFTTSSGELSIFGNIAVGTVSGAITGAAGAALTGGNVAQGALSGAATGAVGGALARVGPITRSLGSATASGFANKAMGGKFEDGFISSLKIQAITGVAQEISDSVASYLKSQGGDTQEYKDDLKLIKHSYEYQWYMEENQIPGPAPDGYKVNGYFSDDVTGYNLIQYRNLEDSQQIDVPIGTKHWVDWLEDGKQALGIPTKQYFQAMNQIREDQATCLREGVSLRLAGHSLGGGIATAAAAVTGLRANVYNPAGVNMATMWYYGHSMVTPLGATVTANFIPGEALSSLSFSLPFLPRPEYASLIPHAPAGPWTLGNILTYPAAAHKSTMFR